jgi:predicted NBD/HSP70 family sugar kinase
MDASDLRRHHLNEVLVRLLREGPRSRATLTNELGFRRATISELVADLVDRGLIEERVAPRTGGAGRPATELVASGTHIGALGLEITSERVTACLTDLTGRRRLIRSEKADNRGYAPAIVTDRLASVLAQLLSDPRVEGITPIGATLAIPGVVKPQSTEIRNSLELEWEEVDLGEFAALLSLPDDIKLRVENADTMAAIGEQFFGAGRGIANFVHIAGGKSIGASLVVENRWVRGTHGLAGSLAHTVVNPSGERCACGNRGCLQTVVSDRAHADLATTADALALALSPVIGVVDPAAIILGGTFNRFGEQLAERLSDRLTRDFNGSLWTSGAVVLGQLGFDATIIGASAVGTNPVIVDPTIIPRRSESA